MYLHGLVKPASQDPLWGKIPGLSGGAMGGPQPLGTLIISSGKLLRTVWMYLRMNKDGFFRTPPPQDSAQGWVNLVLTFAGLYKRETYFRSFPAKSPNCVGSVGGGRGREDVRGGQRPAGPSGFQTPPGELRAASPQQTCRAHWGSFMLLWELRRC